MSTVFYRWGARRDESRVTFDGTHISVFDLKREIILNNKMGNGKDFDLGLFDNVTGEEFKDDNHQIPRSSSLVARRLPGLGKGRGTAQNYIVGTSAADQLQNDHRIESQAREAMLAKQRNQGMRGSGGTFGSMTKRFDGKEDPKQDAVVPISTGNAEEDAKIRNFFAQQDEQWEQTQEGMAMQSRAPAAMRARNKAAPAPKGKFDYNMPTDKEPPQGYICYRCGQKGHWIQDCPNNNDPQAQEKKRYVRVTGIPRSMLKTVDTPVGNEGSSAGAMLTADGGFVQAVPDARQWQKVVAEKPRTMTVAEVRETQPHDPELACPICKKLVWDAVKTPCCSTSFCEECITTWLVEHDFQCESCESKVKSVKDLAVDDELRERVRQYMDAEIARSKKEKEDEDRANGVEPGQDGQKAIEGGDDKPGDDTTNGNSADAGKDKTASANGNANANGNAILDPAKMQEMMNPQTMKLYLSQIAKMLQNPKISPQGKALLQTQLQLVQAGVVQTQAMMGNPAGMGMGMGMGMMGMNEMMGMVMAMGMHSQMGMGMNMGMGMDMPPMGMQGMGMGGYPGPQQHQQQFHHQQQQQPMHQNQNHFGGGGHMPMRGRGGFRGGGGGGFRGGGRGGGGGMGQRSGIPIPQVRPPKRNNDQMEY